MTSPRLRPIPIRRRSALAAALGLIALVAAGCGTAAHESPRSKPPAPTTTAASAPARTVASAAAASTTTTTTTTAASKPAPATSHCPKRPVQHPITRPRWLNGVEITEYFSVPERWFVGRRVSAPGIPGRHRVDWLYSARGVSMEGDGVGLDGRHYHFDAPGDSGWINAAGARTRAGACASRWSRGMPVWLEGGWRNRAGEVTFPLERGGWSRGPGVRSIPYAGVTFAPGSSQPLREYHNVAVDPGLIPTGSRIYIPAYRAINGGWFTASDTGGAIIGRHIDVYRPPTASIDDGGRYLTRQRVYVKPPRG
jgi:3D (Asp-Asp-Asp) domain-containing protein